MKSRGEALRDYVIRRLLLMVPTFLGITAVTVLGLQFVPGGQIDQLRMRLAGAGGGGEVAAVSGGARVQLDIPDEQLAQLREYYGFDKPVLISYLEWLGKVLVLDLGTSTRYGEPVWDTIRDRFPISIFYGVTTLILTYGVCIPLGIAKAIRHRSSFDNITSVWLMYYRPNEWLCFDVTDRLGEEVAASSDAVG